MKKAQQDIIFSVIICTYNRADYLKEALGGFVTQSFDKSLYEIIVVDNKSTDNTGQVVKSFQDKYTKPKISLVFESEQGLGRARNTGVEYAEGEYLDFADDDAKVGKNYLKIASRVIMDLNPSPIVIGGPVLPIYIDRKPSWFKDEYVSTKLGSQSRYLTYGESLSGPNMIIKKSAFKDIRFDERLGMRGDLISAHEETDFLDKIQKYYKRENLIYYCPDLEVSHFIFSYKMTVKYQIKRSFAAGQAWFLKGKNGSFFSTIVGSVKGLTYLIQQTVISFFYLPKYRYIQRFLIERGGKIAFGLGFLLACHNIIFKIRQRA